MGTRLYPLPGGDGDGPKVWYPLGLGMGMWMIFFMRGWVWDSETRPRPAPLPSLRGTINTISGGFASGGSTSSARKKHLRHIQSINHITHSHHIRRMPPITFTDNDFHGLDHQQDDPMVITIKTENYVVKKVLVNQGSSVGILYWATYQKI